MERRDLIKKGAAAAAGLYLGNMINHAKFIAPFKIDPIGISSVPVINPVVEAEELVYRYQPANNGAGPLWCKGSSCIVRIGSKVFASGLETIPEWVPLSNAGGYYSKELQRAGSSRLQMKAGHVNLLHWLPFRTAAYSCHQIRPWPE